MDIIESCLASIVRRLLAQAFALALALIPLALVGYALAAPLMEMQKALQ